MKKFEIHITGSTPEIINNLKRRGLKGIIIDLLSKGGETVTTEYMSSIVLERENYDECKFWVDQLVIGLKNNGLKILRVKIETPFSKEDITNSIYIEAHFIATSWDFPVSKNVGSGKLIATEREYDNSKFISFNEKYNQPFNKAEVELCLFDTNILGDKKWFDLYD